VHLIDDVREAFEIALRPTERGGDEVSIVTVERTPRRRSAREARDA
jgi:hypothetical protein